MKQKSIILLSGGLDSAANLAFCAEKDEPVLALTCDYAQRAAQSEIRAASRLCAYYGVSHEVVSLKWLGLLGGSSLTESSRSIPQIGGVQLDDLEVAQEAAHAVWVPNRNGVLINVAAAYAERLGAAQILVGFNREEAMTFPDNSEEFLFKANESLRLSTAGRVRLASYTVSWNKREIVEELRKQKKTFPFDQLWSCYHGGDKACGNCESCQRLRRALG